RGPLCAVSRACSAHQGRQSHSHQRRHQLRHQRRHRPEEPSMTRPPRPAVFLRAALAAGWLVALGGGAVLAADPPPAGPPFPAPVIDQTVYDYADILSADTEARV